MISIGRFSPGFETVWILTVFAILLILLAGPVYSDSCPHGQGMCANKDTLEVHAGSLKKQVPRF